MPVFLSKKINNIVNEVAIIEWHSKDSFLAIATHTSNDSGDINVLEYQSNSMQSVDGMLVSRPNIVTSLSWHPKAAVLAVGWSSGCISVFYVSHRNAIDLTHTMESRIASVTWSSKGTKLLTTDSLGTICIWKQNALGEIPQKPYITLAIDSTITCSILLHIVVKDKQHMDISSLAKAAVKGDEKALELLSFKKTSDLCPASVKLCESSTFLVGLDDGRILRVSSEATSTSNIAETGLNRLTTLASCEGGILSLLCHSDAGFLIVITDKAMLYHYQLTPPNGATLKEITKMKLAVGLTGPPSLTWAGDCVLAMATGEPVVRLWDVEHADNYTLVPNLSDCDGHNRTIKVLQVAYSSKHQILAAGLNNGMVAFWQYGEELRTHCDLAKMLQSDPTLGGYQSHADEFGLFEGEDGLANSRPINLEYTANGTHRPHGQDKGPEANWHPQPTAILCSKPEDEFTTGFSGLSRQVQLLAWDGSEDRLVIAVSARQLNNQTNFNHGLTPRCAAYLLEQQPLCGHFGGQGCAAVQTGPRSLAMFTVTLANKSPIGDTMKLTTESNDPDGRINPLTVPQPSGLPAVFIATSTAFMPGGLNIPNQKTSLLPDELNSIPLIREHEAQVEDQIRALYCTQEYVSYWNGYRISTFKHATGDCIIHYASFPCDFRLVGMYEQTLFTVEPFKLQVRTLQGTVKQLINFTESEGSVVQTTQCTNWMACLTEHYKLRIFDLARREIKCVHSSKSLAELVLSTALTGSLRNPYSDTRAVAEEKLKTASASPKELHIASVAVNQSGDAISFTIDILSDGCVAEVRWPSDYCSKNSADRDSPKFQQKVPTETEQQEQKQQLLRDETSSSESLKKCIPDTRIYIYYLEKDKLQYFDFCATWPDASWLNVTSNNNVTIGRWPKHHFWDQYEPRLLAIEAAALPLTHPIYGKQYSDCNDRPSTTDHLMPPMQMDRQHEETARSRTSTSPEHNVEEHDRASSKMTEMPGSIHLSSSKLSTQVVSLFTSADQANPVVLEHFPMEFQHSALLGLEVPYYYFSVRCDLVYRLVNEQCQRRRELATSSRRLVSDGITDDGFNIPDLASNCAEPYPSGDKSTDCVAKKMMTDGPNPLDSNNSANVKIHYINRRVLRDFIDLEQADGSTREAMLSFSYYLTMGEMDAAFKAMKLIKSPTVWQNMARMCVSTCRLDVARLCLGKMGNPMAALMVREARAREPEAEAHAGELAIQLGMPDEAERLFTQCGRWDLVIRLYQSLGQWDKALHVAASHNRIALRATHYAYAKELESMGKVEQAIEHYIQSETYRFEVPRMLKSSPDMLENFVNQQQDKSVYRWWAQTLEAQGKLDEARAYYVQAKDYLSLVRVLCCLGRNEDAETLCNETGDPAACYHLARQMEANGGIEQAIRLFTRAKAYSSAVRLCKEHNRNDHLYSLAQLGRVEDMLEAATHLESVPSYANKAVLLFHKAGHIGRAVELAFQTRQYAALQTVASSLDDKIDPTLLRRCAEFFTQNNQFDRAVDVLAAGKQYWEALKLCAEYNVPITDDLADKLTPLPNGTMPDSERSSILIELGELCLSQGQYHLACKQFTQAGSRIAAMKALLRSGDTSKIIFFANVSKQKEIYVMAANYLQTLDDWRSNVDYMRTIVQFYTRGRAPESLASFYESCAHAEIEEFGSYEKATGALTEAYKVLLKAINSTTTNEATELRLQKRLTQIKNKATMCKEFAQTQVLFSVDPLEAMRNCQTLLENTEPGDILRPGDIYAAMIREFVSKGKYQAALACMQEMRERLNGSNQSVMQYIDRNTLETIHRAINVPMPEEAKESESKPNSNEITELIESPVSEDDILDASVSNGSDDGY